METMKEEGVFKIYFKGASLELDKEMNLTFYYHSDLVEKFDEFPTFMLNYNELTRKKQSFSFNNITEVITYGKANKSDIVNFYAILRTELDANGNEKEKQGYLIARNKDQQDLIVGYWPYPYFLHHIEMHLNPAINLRNMLQNPEKFREILIVS